MGHLSHTKLNLLTTFETPKLSTKRNVECEFVFNANDDHETTRKNAFFW